MGNITETLGKNRCSSCGMCYSVCPKNCIDVIYDKKQGFYYPAVNAELLYKLRQMFVLLSLKL